MTPLVRRVNIGIAAIGTLGLLTSIVLTAIEGVKYRIREEQGLDPVWAPDWVAIMTYIGVAVFLAAALALVGIGAIVRPKETGPADQRELAPEPLRRRAL